MWPDIDSAPVWRTLPPLVERMRRTKERFDANLFFLNADSHLHLSDRLAAIAGEQPRSHSREESWLTWAAIVSLGAVYDSAALDFRDWGLGVAWKDSQERVDLRNDPLLAVLTEMRNYTVHLEFHKEVSKPFRATFAGEEHDYGEQPYFSPILWEDFSQLRNIRKGWSPVTQEMIGWFNRQALHWPSSSLLWCASQRCYTRLGAFTERHRTIIESRLPNTPPT